MKDPFEFSIAVPSTSVSPTDHVVLTMALANTSQQDYYVNARFAVVPKVGDVWLTVRHDGKEVPYKFRVRLRPLEASDFLLLKPEERVVAAVELSKGYALTEGTYEIEAVYMNAAVPDVLKKYDVFVGQVAAAPVKLKVGD
jgi:hypothetical protein